MSNLIAAIDNLSKVLAEETPLEQEITIILPSKTFYPVWKDFHDCLRGVPADYAMNGHILILNTGRRRVRIVDANHLITANRHLTGMLQSVTPGESL